MHYKYPLSKRLKFPTYQGLLLVFLSFATLIYLRNVSDSHRKIEYVTPLSIRVTNVSSIHATISWTTETKTNGIIVWGENENKLNSKLPSEIKNSKTHYATLTNLNPSSNYYFEIISDGLRFDNNKAGWKINTGAGILTAPPPKHILKGTVQKPSGLPAKNSLVYVTAAGGNTLSTYTNNDGSYKILLSDSLTNDLSDYLSVKPSSTLIEIVVHTSPFDVASAHIYMKSAHYVPPIVIGKFHDFKSLPATQPDIIPTVHFEIPIITTPTLQPNSL